MDSLWGKMMKEAAKEEMQMLEFLHPNCFHSSKLELKSYISSLHSSSYITFPSSSMGMAASQGSTSRKKRKKGCSEFEEILMKESNSKHKQHRDRVDIVLEKAQSCLQKLQAVKKCLL